MRRGVLLGTLLGFVVAGVLVALLRVPLANWFVGERQSAAIIDASLRSVKAQNRLNVFAARVVVTVTSERSRLGGLFSARQTLIVPGTVHYELDMSRLDRRSLDWNEATRTLTVTVAPPSPSIVEIDLHRITKFSDGAILSTLTDVEKRLDADNAAYAQTRLRAEAATPVLLGLARDAGRDAITRNFALPLAAAGFPATVAVRFAGPAR